MLAGLLRRGAAPSVLVVAVLLVSSCSSSADGAATSPVGSPSATTTTNQSPTVRAATPSTAGRAPVIVIDPGHSGKSIRSTGKNGLHDIDYPNYPEIYEMFDVSTCAAKALRADGYRVLLTKKHALSSVSHTKRAAIANDAKADLAISVHDDHGVGVRFEHTYDQRGVKSNGSYPKMYRGKGSHRTVYSHKAVAKRSHTYAGIIAKARSKAQKHPTTIAVNSYNGRAPLEPGNLALVQLFSKVPWVYNEMGALTHGSTTQAMSIRSETRYATGLVTGVEKAVPLVPGRANPPASTASLHACLIARVEPSPGVFTRPHRYLPYHFS